MTVTLYSLELSHPANAVRMMLEHKGMEHRVVNLMPGAHPVQLRARGFANGTVPALKVDGRRVQGSREVSRLLDELHPSSPLFPADPSRRAAVIEAERWCEAELQPTPRVVFRWGAKNTRRMRRFVAELTGLPGAALVSRLNKPVASHMARLSGATDDRVRATLAALPGSLDHVDALIADGTICGGDRNAAEFQILATVRTLLTFEDLCGFVTGRPCEGPARELWPNPIEPVPACLPAQWLA